MEKNSYKTKQRELILQCLMKNKNCALTTDEIVETLKQNGSNVGRTTVYRFVESLVNEGKARKFVPTERGSASFQFVEHQEHCGGHLHLKCLSCGHFVHLGCEQMNEVNSHIFDEHGFYIDNTKSVLLGFCKKCYEESKTSGGAR